MSSALHANDFAPSERRLENGWRLVEEITNGATSEIWRAVSPDDRTQAVAKILNARYREVANVRQAFAREAEVLSRVRSSHFPNLIAATRYESWPCLLLSYEPACESLAHHLRARRHHSTAYVCTLANQICLACSDLHAQHMVHADLKPANILIARARNRNLRAMLIDLGNAVDCGESAHGGSAAFMSPEQAHGLPLDARSDVFSLGMILFRVLSGTSFYETMNAQSVLRELAKISDDAVKQRCAILDANWREVLFSLLRPARDARSMSMQDVRLQLRCVYERAGA